MKKTLFTVLAICIGLASFAALPVIDPELEAEMQCIGNEDKTKVVILLSEQSDATTLSREADFFATKQERRAFVVETLKRQAEPRKPSCLACLRR